MTKNMKDKLVQQTTIIGGEDGPVSVFIAGKGDDFKLPLKDRFRNKRYQMRRKEWKREFGRKRIQKKRLLLMQKKNMVFFR